jgi:hypothetical protein
MRLILALAALLVFAPLAAAEPPGVTRAAIFAAEDELAGGSGSVRASEPAPLQPGQIVLVDTLTGAEIVGPVPLAAGTEIAPPTEEVAVSAPERRFLTWAGRQAPVERVALRGRSE